MSKITYENKVGIEPKTIAINQCQDIDLNMIKNVVNDNDTCVVSTTLPMLFDKTSAGRRYGTFDDPITGAIAISQTGIEEGGCAVIIWLGDANPLITGGVIQSMAGDITEEGIYSIYFHHLNGRFNVNIFNVTGNVPLPASPNQMTIVNITGADTWIPNRPIMLTAI